MLKVTASAYLLAGVTDHSLAATAVLEDSAREQGSRILVKGRLNMPYCKSQYLSGWNARRCDREEVRRNNHLSIL